MTDQTPIIHGEPSVRLQAGPVECALTLRGGHLGPVSFQLADGRKVSPYSLAPWQPADCAPGTPDILRVLRGDFFCLPFGEGDADMLIHGEPANCPWQVTHRDEQTLVAELAMQNPRGQIRKTVSLDGNSRAIYQEHVISGLTGDFNFGHHAILEFPAGEGEYGFNTSPIAFGGVKPPPYDNPAAGEYGSLPPGARFTSLAEVPLARGGQTDLRQYPAREGFEDLVMVSSVPGEFAWTAATLDGYIWFALKDPRQFPSTMFWISNGGRHSEPWRGKHRRRLGLEEVCAFFSDGLRRSREEPLKTEGIPTIRRFSADETVSLRMIQGVHPVPADFGLVTEITRREDPSVIVLANARGVKVEVPVNWSFLYPQT